MLDKLNQIWKARYLRNNILFVLLMLVIFRLTAHIPVPGVDAAALKNLFSSNLYFYCHHYWRLEKADHSPLPMACQRV